MSIERIYIDQDKKYTYEFDHGRVSLLRHGEPWIEHRELQAPKAWISAANEIERLRQRIVDLETEIYVSRVCEECHAEPGEKCQPYCIGAAQHQDEIPG